MTDSRLQSTGDPSTRSFPGAELRRARRQAGLTQAELAEQLGVRLWTVEQWESGATQVPVALLPKIVAATGMQPPEESEVAPEASQLSSDEAAQEDDPDESALGGRTLDPADLQLPRSLRGYDPAAVEALLGELAATTERLQADIAASGERVAHLEAELDESENRTAALHEGLPDLQRHDALLRDALVTAHRAAHEVREEARQNALQVLRAARKRGKRIIREAERERRRIEERVAELQREAERSRSDLRDFLLALLERVESRRQSDEGADGVGPSEDRPNLADVIFEHEMASTERQASTVDGEPSVAVDSETV